MASIFNIFGKSPIAPLQEHMARVTECVQTLLPFFELVVAGHWDAATQLHEKIASLENQADEIKRDVRGHLPKALFTAVDRSDVLALLNLQDLIANRAKDIAGVIVGRRMVFPSEIVELCITLLKRSIDATLQANQAIHELDEWQEAGFAGRESTIIEKMISELLAIEEETDALQIKVRVVLRGIEKDLPPIDVMFLYDIIKGMGRLADKAQNVGDHLHILLGN
jgi:predicted phosphate transport protein (TIGR00153 family)